MPQPCRTVFRQRICHSPACATVFYLCRHCDRGQRYCSPRCREKSRRQQRRQANQRHQQSLEGRLDHRDRQRNYRQRQAQARVTDQSSLPDFSCDRMIAAEPQPPLETAPVPPFPPPVGSAPDSGWVVCQLCRRWGRWVNPFHFQR